MRFTLESTPRRAIVDGAATRIWTGTSADGTPVQCFVAAVFPDTTDESVRRAFYIALGLREPRDHDDWMPPAAAPAPSFDSVFVDPVAQWRALPPDAQERIGAAALAATIGKLGASIAAEQGGCEAARRFEAIGSEAQSLLYEHVTVAVLDGDDERLPPPPDLRPLGVRQCRDCGCTDDFACPDGCSWVLDDLCSQCAGLVCEALPRPETAHAG